MDRLYVNGLLTCIYHVFSFVMTAPGNPLLVEECLACHLRTGRTRMRQWP